MLFLFIYLNQYLKFITRVFIKMRHKIVVMFSGYGTNFKSIIKTINAAR